VTTAADGSAIPPILILGGGGHAKGLIEALRLDAPEVRLAILDARPADGSVLGVPIIGTDEMLDIAATQGFRHFVVGLGGVRDNTPRARLFERARATGLTPWTVVHRSATIAASARLGVGTQCLSGSLVCADARLGENVIINTGAIVEHDCQIGNHVHVASGAVLAGTVEIGDFAHIGAGAVVLQSRKIGPGAVVGGGAVVTRSVCAGATVYGVPARVPDPARVGAQHGERSE
jgi:sugar O-acyltransferase (sialic acid O-acetyltransferase NeuD family)